MSHTPRITAAAAGLAALASLTAAQAHEWTQQGPLPTGLDVHDVDMVSPSEAWLVAEGGRVCHTTDGGLTWTKKDLATDSLWEVFFVDAQNGWAVGNAIFKTTNGGATWQKLPYVTGSLYGVHFIDPLHGWLTGTNTVHRTTDGGATWEWSLLPEHWASHGVFFEDAQHGWVSNINGDLFESTDGGATWTKKAVGGLNQNTVWFDDNGEGFAVASDTVLHTVNDGATWETLSLPAGSWGYDASFFDADRAVLVGAGGSVVSTDDGWQTATIEVPQGGNTLLWSVDFFDDELGLAVGEQGRVLASGDGGVSWFQRDSGGMDVHGLDANDVAHAWMALEQGDVARTTNGGAQWITERVDGFSVYGSVRDVDFLGDNLTGWVAGWDNAFSGTTGTISRSLDGGRTWQVQYTKVDFFLEAVCAVDANTAFAGGNHPFGVEDLVRTSDGGQSWQPVAVGLGIVNDIDFADAQRGWAVGGRILATQDGGDSWSIQLDPLYTLEAIDFDGPLHGWAVGWPGQAFRTLDGGATWTPVSDPLLAGKTLLGVSVVDANTIWISGPDGFVARTLDGGATWAKETLGFAPGYTAGFSGVDFLDADYGWVGGGPRVDNGGPWLRTAGDPPGFALLNDRVRAGFSFDVRTSGAAPGELVVAAYSLAGITPAGCGAPGATGLCLGLQPPLFAFASGFADATGGFAVTVPVPAAVPFVDLHLQALRVDPSTGALATSNTTTTRIEP